jgi:hypothetical protein
MTNQTLREKQTPPPIGSLAATRKRVARPMIVAAALVAVVYLSLTAFVIRIDPHNIYSWGHKMRIAAGQIPRDLVIDWIDVAAKDETYNTFLVGSSVTAEFTPETVEKVLGPDARVANLSYGGPRPKDRNLVLDRVGKNPNVERIILTFDWTYIRSPDVKNRSFPAFLYDDDILNDLRQVNLPTVVQAFKVAKGQRIYSNPDRDGFAKYTDQMYQKFQTADAMSDLAHLIKLYQTSVGASSMKTCDAFGAINDQLIPDLRAFSQRGIKVDILVPVTSYAFYFVRQTDISPTVLDQSMMARRCLVDGTKDLENVRIFAFDSDPKIAGDLANFRDVGHIYGAPLQDMFISAIGSDRYLLTSENLENQEITIRKAVENYNLTNTGVKRSSSTDND